MGTTHHYRIHTKTSPESMSIRTIPILLLVGATFTGCGLRDPYLQRSQKGAAQSKETKAQVPGLLPPHSFTLAKSATDAVARFTTVWVSWSATTLFQERVELSELATGQLKDELRREAAEVAKTRREEVSRFHSCGRYVGIIASHAGRLVVVTYEEVAPIGGRGQGAYHVYLARTEHTAQGWKLSEWQPATDN
jgi:hypothetical protein